jgi:hypothetical protein
MIAARVVDSFAETRFAAALASQVPSAGEVFRLGGLP